MAESVVKASKKKYVLVRSAEPIVETKAPKTIKRKIKIVRDEDIVKNIPITLGDEVQQALEEWYAALGQKLPDEYVGFGNKVDEDERKRFGEEMKLANPIDPSLGIKQVGIKPEFGTPEFWKWARERRAEKNAERAAKGLPPLPSKGNKTVKAVEKPNVGESKVEKDVNETVTVKKVKKVVKKPLEENKE